MTTDTSQYMFDNATPEAATQLRLLAEILDPHSTGVLAAAGVAPGMRCLDAGVGLGTITRWLSQQVGPTGQVVAVDQKPALTSTDNIEVRIEDIRYTELEPASFDVVHARLLLMHLPQRREVLARLVGLLRPGGVIVISDWDCTWRDMIRACPDADAAQLVDRFQSTLLGIGEKAGADMHWAAEIHEAMGEAGLVDVHTVTDSRSWAGGTGICLLHRSNSIQLEEHLLGAGMTEPELVALREVLMDERLVLSGYLMHTSTGRRPAVV